MPDNLELNAGSGGATLATDDIAGIHYQRVKVQVGGDGSAGDVSSANPLPVILASNSGVDSGDFTVNNGDGSQSVPVQGAASADDPAAGNPVYMGGRASAAAPTDVSADGDAVPIWTTLKGAVNVADGGGSLTIDGTVTANLSATDNAVLDAIEADTSGILTAVQILDNAIAGNEMQVDVVSSALPTGAATAANQLPDGHNVTVDNGAGAAAVNIQDGGNSITVDGSITANAGTNLNTSALALESGGNLAAIATDAAAMESLLGTIDADTGNIAAGFAAEGAALGSGVLMQGDDGTDRTNVLVDTDGHLQVDVLTGGGGGTQYTEGDTDASITGTAILWEDAADTLRAASAANPFPVEIVAGAGSGGTAAADDADFTAGTTSGTPVMGVYQSTPTNVTDGDMGIVGITQSRAMRVSVDNTSIPITDNGGSLTVDGTVTANAGTGPWPVTDNGGSLTVDNGGTFAVQAAQSGSWTVTANAGTNLNTSALGTSANQSTMITALQLIDNASVDHDAAVVSGVTQVGLDARSTNGTAVASGDATRAQGTLLGKQVVYPYALPGTTWQYAGPTGGITNTADNVIQSAGGAGVRHYLTSLTVVNAHSTVATEVVIKDGSTVIHRGYAAAAGGGYTITFPTPLRGTAATALNVACITTGSATHVSASGFSAAE